MSENLKELILSKRKQRARLNNENADEPERPLSPQREDASNVIPKSVLKKAEINQAFTDDDDKNAQSSLNDNEDYADTFQNADASNPANQIIQTAIINKHRSKSRELLKNISDEDPNKIVEELHEVRDKIKDKIKDKLIEGLAVIRKEEEEKKDDEKKNDLKLDLTSSTLDPNQGTSTGRESLLQKINRIKQQAGEKSNYRLIGSSRREATRFDETLETREDEDKKKLEKIKEQSAKRRFQKISKAVIEEIHLPNLEEQFDFFANTNWPVEEEPEKTIEKKSDKPDLDVIRSEEPKPDEGDGTKATDKTPLIIKMEDWREVSYTRAIYLPHQQQKEISNKLLFMPKTNNVPLKRKLGEEAEKPRLLEEEGYYVGRKPYMTKKNRNMMEDRMITFPNNIGLKWFGVDGELIALPDPIKYVATRPSFTEFFIDTQFRKALYLEDFANNLLVEKGALNTINIAKYRIDLDINQAKFTFHNLFSVEHVIAFRLQSMYDHYKITEDQKIGEILSSKLKALKEALERFKNEIAIQIDKAAAEKNLYIESNGAILKNNVGPQDKSEYISKSDLNKLNAYKNEIKQTRQQRDIELKQKKNLCEQIVQTWKELKDIRAKQQFRNTDIKLIIKKKDVNETKEQKQLEKEIKEEFDEIVAERKEELEKETNEYNVKFKAWKFQQTKKTEAKKRQEEREKEKNNAQINANITSLVKNKEMEENDLKILSEEDLPKPNKPQELDEDGILESLREHYRLTRKAPGEPILYFDLVEESGSISPSDQCSTQEKIRRQKLARTKVFAKIFLNGKLVYTTSESQLQNDFTVRWGQIFNIYMITHPDSIVVQIFDYYESRSRERMIAEINIPSPELNCTSSNYSLEEYEFASQEPFYLNIKKSTDIDRFFVSGILKAGSGWGIDEKDGSVLAPPLTVSQAESALKQDEMKNFDPIAALGVSRMQDLEKLAKWIMKSNLDPNDPRNSDLINLIRTLTESDGTDSTFSGFRLPDYFRLDQMIQEFNFSNDEEIEINRRYRLIILRAQEEPEFRGYKMIPANERYVRRDQFDLYEKRKLKELTGDEEEEQRPSKPGDTLRSTKTKELENEIELKRAHGQKIMRKIRERILKQFKFTQAQKTLADMVIEEQVPNINALSNLFWNLYIEPRRPLYPTRRERKKVKGQNVSPDDIYILVNVVNAYDLPVRKDKLTDSPMKVIKDPISGKTIKVHEHIAGESLVRPFVEVTFQENIYRTATADGPNASWNQEMRLPFKAPNDDLRPESLQTCKDNIYINLFDEVVVDALEDEKERDFTIHKKLQRYWLGSLKIPFSTVYFKSKIEGTFKLETPPILLGYTRDPRLSHIQTFTTLETGLNMDTPIKESSYISLFVTIEPQLLVPDAYRETYDSLESIELLDKVVKWATDLRKKFPNREFKPIVMNTEGKSVLITRYFRSIKPPEELIENKDDSFETACNVARFVTMIPFVSDSMVFPGISDIWSTCDQFMEILSGDEEEHAVLIVNLFLGLGKKAWLLIGSSITNGLCSYPLSIENNDYTIWYQGEPYKVNEPHNPVKVVSALVNPDNMWFNIQSFEEPYRIQFDVNNTRNWRPFFNKSNNNKFESIQPERLIYYKTELKFVKEIESKIETKLRDKIQEWRPHHISKFNRYFSSTLRKILEDMEKTHYTKLQNKKEPEELTQFLANSRLSGYPINLPYTNMNSIIDAVYACQVHAIPTSDVEFGLAVHIYPYSNTILSVWIYVASLIRKS